MEENNGKKILIIGSSATAYSLAKKLQTTSNISEVIVAPGNDAIKEFCTTVDIRENKAQELLDYAMENAVDLTIVCSESAIKEDIASLFNKHNQMIFAPGKESAQISLNKSTGKKFMYKTRIPCPKFGIFDKAALAVDYVRSSNMPVVIKTDEHQPKGVLVCNSFSIAKKFIEELFETGEKKIIIEDYIFGHEFSFYVITDGYHAIPLGSVANFKHELEGNGGALTSGMGSFAPDYKVSREIEYRIMQQIIFPTLNNLDRQRTPYIGILGIDFVLDQNNNLYALEFNTFLKSTESQTLLALINENIYHLFEACAIGSFADDYNHIDISNKAAASCAVIAKKENSIIEGLDKLEEETLVAHFNTRKNKYLEYETTGGRTLVLTRTANVLSKAFEDLYEELSMIKFEGIKYRKDFCK